MSQPSPSPNSTHAAPRSALAVKRANGQRVGAVPYCFDLDADGTTLVPNTTEQAVIEDIKAMCGKGWTREAVAEDLTERGVSTKTKRSMRWTHQTVARIISRCGAATNKLARS